jgi:hypothetical protein
MPISYLKSTANNNGYLVRPSSYTFPLGLNQISGTITSIDYLVVAGGGGGGSDAAGGGGGGAGGFKTASGTTVATGSSYTITVGAGGLVEELEGMDQVQHQQLNHQLEVLVVELELEVVELLHKAPVQEHRAKEIMAVQELLVVVVHQQIQ